MLGFAALLLALDMVATLALSGRLGGGNRGRIAGIVLGAVIIGSALPQDLQAQATDADAFARAATQDVVLAHVVTGDTKIDDAAQAGLVGLSNALAQRTSVEPATPMAVKLGVAPRDARLFMVTDGRWKFMHAEGGFRPMLFDLENDPDEFVDQGESDDHAQVIRLMYDRLGKWGLRMSQRVTRSDEDIAAMRGKSRRKGILLGVYSAGEVDPELSVKYRRPVPKK